MTLRTALGVESTAQSRLSTRTHVQQLRVFSVQRRWPGAATRMFSPLCPRLLIDSSLKASSHRYLRNLCCAIRPVTRVELGGPCGVVISRRDPGQRLRAYSQHSTTMSLTPAEIIAKIPESFDKAQAAGDLLFFPSTIYKHNECDVDVSPRSRLP